MNEKKKKLCWSVEEFALHFEIAFWPFKWIRMAESKMHSNHHQLNMEWRASDHWRNRNETTPNRKKKLCAFLVAAFFIKFLSFHMDTIAGEEKRKEIKFKNGIFLWPNMRKRNGLGLYFIQLCSRRLFSYSSFFRVKNSYYLFRCCRCCCVFWFKKKKKNFLHLIHISRDLYQVSLNSNYSCRMCFLANRLKFIAVVISNLLLN